MSYILKIIGVYLLYKNKPNIQFMHIKTHTCKTDFHSIRNEKC